MISRGNYSQTEPEIVWSIAMPEGSTKGRPLAAYDGLGNSLEIDSWSLESGILHVNFGVDPVIGELEYEYQVEGGEQVLVDSNGNAVSITINQYGGVATDPVSFP